jgi:thymidylate synthase (FAD)
MHDLWLSKIYPIDYIGFVELLDSMASDLTVVNAARVSFNKDSKEMGAKEASLIKHLMKNRHGTPFEHCVFQFRVKAPLFVVQQWERHRMASYNEESARWSKMNAEFYIPDENEAIRLRSKTSYALYESLLAGGMPREKARLVLPGNLYKTFWFTVNARSLMNFISLRNDDHAQEEIRQYGAAIEQMFARAMPVTFDAFKDNGRVAP